jgi:TorA maturation chaperone TorD
MTAARERLRAESYRLLGTCFSAPRRDEWERDRVGRTLANVLDALDPDGEAAALAAALDDALGEADALALEVDHAALFVGPFALKAPPYGSVYLDDDHALMGDSTLGAARCYAAAGLTLTLQEPADHVAIELEFMAYLAALSARAVEGGDPGRAEQFRDAQHRFLTEHIGAWAPAFCAAVLRGAETRFYRTLARCLLVFLDAHARAAAVGATERGTRR